MLPDILWQLDENQSWLARVVNNLYPIVAPPAGHHEVIIDTPHHSLPIESMTADIWRSILAAYNARICALSPKWRYLSLFRNVGKRAGGSLGHPHSQLIGLAHTPRQIQLRRRRLRNAYQKRGCCSLCEAIGNDQETKDRVVTRSGAYVAIVPELAEVPFEIWVVPVAHSSLFALSEENEQFALAHTLRDVFQRLSAVLGEFDHNMMLTDAGTVAQPYLHWFLRIRPIMGAIGGFELSTGISVNSSQPTENAAALRAAVPVPDADNS